MFLHVTPLLLEYRQFFAPLQENCYPGNSRKFMENMEAGLKLTSHSILRYLGSADLSKSFSQLIVLIFTFLINIVTDNISVNSFCQYLFFLNIFFNRFCPVEVWGNPTLAIS